MNANLSAADKRHLTAAQGYAELKMFGEAHAEIEFISAEHRADAEVLMVRLDIYEGLGRWERLSFIARQLTRVRPSALRGFLALAHSTHRTIGANEAAAVLEHALKQHPVDAKVRFDLARYYCHAARISEARAELKRCFDIDPAFRLLALDDPDFDPVWAEETIAVESRS